MNSDEFDLDDDAFQDEAQTPKETLKKLWEDNPVFKVIVIVGGIILVYVAYNIFFNKTDEALVASRVSQASNVTSVPGEGEADPAFRAAVKESNQQRAEEATRTGMSVIPTPIGSNDARIDVPSVIETGEENPLETWRRTSDAVKIARNESEPAPAPDQELAPILDPFAAPPLTPAVSQVAPPPPQPVVAHNPDLITQFAEQMRVIMATKQPQPASLISTSFPSMYQQYLDEQKAAEAGSSQMTASTGDAGYAAQAATPPVTAAGDAAPVTGESEEEVILPAGTVSYAQIITAVNSDVEGPVLAHILSGPLAGSRAIGEFKLSDKYLVLSFDKVVKGDVVYSTEAYALDENTTLAGVRSDVEHHWIQRIVLPAAAEFIAGMGSAIAETTTTTTVVDGAAVTDKKDLNTDEEVARGLERGAERVSEIVDQFSNRPVTVTLEKGTPIGMLFVESVKSGDAE